MLQSFTSVSAGHGNAQALLILCTRHLTENRFHWLLLGTKAKPGDFCKEAALVTMKLFPAMTCINQLGRCLWTVSS